MLFLEAIIVIGSILIVLILIIKRFVYFHPVKNFVPYNESYIDVYQNNLHGWFISGSSDKVILFCHGNAGNISFRQDKINRLNSLGYNVLIFDYTGYGKSQGSPSENGCYFSADVFINYLFRRGYEPNKIIPYGESLGAAVAAYTARKYNTSKIIIESGLPGMSRVVKAKIPFLRWLSFAFPEFDTVKYLSWYRGKILFLHSQTDEVVPFSSTEEIRKIASKIVLCNGTHNQLEIDWKSINEFINSD